MKQEAGLRPRGVAGQAPPCPGETAWPELEHLAELPSAPKGLLSRCTSLSRGDDLAEWSKKLACAPGGLQVRRLLVQGRRLGVNSRFRRLGQELAVMST